MLEKLCSGVAEFEGLVEGSIHMSPVQGRKGQLPLSSQQAGAQRTEKC